MKFVDKASIEVKAGNGGDGMVSFRQEKYVDRGGPDGGDGGDGGNVVFRVDKNLNSLQKFRFNPKLVSENGQPGAKQKKRGKNGPDLIVDVPLGTVISTETATLADMDNPDQKSIVASGGKGGFGNAHFKSSVRRGPKVAEKGTAGEHLNLELELKLIADVGVVGLPNAGKSTFLSVVSNAKPEIADYPFTTLSPNLGVVYYGKSSILLADIPGLIEGASRGKGLGDEFLRHIERTKILIHLIDIYDEDPAKSYEIIQKELKSYKVDLSSRPQIVALTKIEGLDKETVNSRIKEVRKVVTKGTEITAISSYDGTGVKKMVSNVAKLLKKQTRQNKGKKKSSKDIPRYTLDNGEAWQVRRKRNGFEVSGVKIEQFAQRTDFDNQHGVRRLRDIMNKTGIIHELERQNVQPGDKISFKGHSKYLAY